MKNKSTLPELLAPAKDMQALKSAIASGADAVYFGTDLFNARMRANNFNLDEAREAIRLCHAHGVKAFVTLNIAILDREIEQMLDYVSSLYESGVDALIVSDIGAMRLIKEHFPSLEIHASTQASVHNIDGVRALEGVGCARVVVARELDKDSIKQICDEVNAEIEMFVHGAHCMSVSGQCLMSYAMGGRSGNRGECAQPCRLPYKIGKNSAYPLSLKDMSLCTHIDEIIDTGASSLKIEGRMKSADYVGGTVKIWRELLDKKRNAGIRELSHLEALFSRQGFTDGYFKSRIDDAMLGVRSEQDKEITKGLESVEVELEKPKINMHARFVLGEKSSLTVSNGTQSVTVYGDAPEVAISAPMSESDIIKNLSKLGTTPLSLGEIEIEKSEGIMVRVSALNALRRKAIDTLLGAREPKKADYVAKKRIFGAFNKRTALFSRVEQIPENSDYFDIIFVYADRYKKDCGANGICLPPVILDKEWKDVLPTLKDARSDGIKYALASNIGQINILKELGFEIICDFRFNVFNGEGAEYLKEKGAKSIILSPELTLPQARDIGGSLIAYGKFPVMTTHKCVIKSTEGCDRCKAYLGDRTGAKMYCEGIFGHRNIIYNATPIYMADKLSVIKEFPLHFIFTDEKRDECYGIIEAYKSGRATNEKMRRIKV